MGHNLFQNRMAYAGETPWHRLGTELPDSARAAEVIRAANLDWKVHKKPAPGARTINVKDKTYDRYVLEREAVDDEKEPVILAVVSGRYEPLQNGETFAFFEPFVSNRWAQFHTAGALGNGERIWILAKLEELIVVGKDDLVQRFLLLSNTHDGSGAVSIRFTPIRVVCQNTLNLAMKAGRESIAIRHTRNIAANLANAQAGELKRIVDKVFGDAQTLFGRMAMHEMQARETERFLELVFPRTDRQKKRNERPERWIRVYQILSNPVLTPKSTSGSLWALYNAIVRDEDYRESPRASADSRLERVWFGAGCDLKLKALRLAQRHLRRAA